MSNGCVKLQKIKVLLSSVFPKKQQYDLFYQVISKFLEKVLKTTVQHFHFDQTHLFPKTAVSLSADCSMMLWFNSIRQLSPTQPVAHFPLPGWGKNRKVKVRKLVG